MSVTEIIPLRCQGCHFFYEDLQRTQALEAELDILDQEDERDTLTEQDLTRNEVERRLAKVLLGLGFLKEKLEHNQFYTVGCPGFDMSDSTRTGEAAQIGRCRSLIIEL